MSRILAYLTISIKITMDTDALKQKENDEAWGPLDGQWSVEPQNLSLSFY